jgi:PAS domain-containing protein
MSGPSFRSSLVPMVIADNERRHVAANPAACLLLRLPESDVRDLRIDDLTSPEARPAIDEATARTRSRWAFAPARSGSISETAAAESRVHGPEPELPILAMDFPGFRAENPWQCQDGSRWARATSSLCCPISTS